MELFDTIPDAAVIADQGGTILRANRAACGQLGRKAEELPGSDLHALLHPAALTPAECPVCTALRAGRTGAVKLHFPGERWQEVSLTPLEGGVLHIGRDITASQRLQQRLLLSESERDELAARVESLESELAAANKELESFSYSVSHDLRGPLRAINGFSQALVEDCAEQLDANGRDYLDRIAKASRHMSELIDGILVLSRVLRRELVLTDVDLSQLAEEIAHRLQSSAPERRVRILIEPGISVRGDINMMRLLLEHLLGNAWKFSAPREEPVITLESSEHDGRRVISVRDNGVGFDMRFADKLFRPFQRLHAQHRFPGTGIGLATVRRIVQRHGGEVWAEGEVERFAAVHFSI